MKHTFLTLFLLSCLAAGAQQIPELHAQSLANTPVNLPADLHGRIAVLVIGFSKASSSQTKVWGESISRDFGGDARVVYYQMPVLADVPGFIRGIVIDSVRKGLPPAARSQFVPILKDPAPWKNLVAFSASDDAYVVVTNAQGQEQWRTHGSLQADVYSELKKHIQALEAASTAN